jgi:predicted TIM-barrel fold metal-dependent hydrolase
MLREVGVDRVIFGGDYPLDEPPAAVRAVISRGFTDGELAAILRRNTAALSMALTWGFASSSVMSSVCIA